MTHEEFMKLPLESRRKIEAAIVDLNKAVEDTFGISMLTKVTSAASSDWGIPPFLRENAKEESQ